MTADDILSRVSDRRTISVGDTALWDESRGVFRIKVQGNRDVGSITILRSAPLPISHLDHSAPARRTKLGAFLRSRLEIEVNAAIQRGDRRIADSLNLLSREDSAKI
jgi:hypothetical protein